MLGICAADAPTGLSALKQWVSGLSLPRGLLHGMDDNGKPRDMTDFGPVYIKYNSVASAADPAGTATLSSYGGDFRGVYFNPDLADGGFRQYAVLPLGLFEDAGAGEEAARAVAATSSGATASGLTVDIVSGMLAPLLPALTDLGASVTIAHIDNAACAITLRYAGPPKLRKSIELALRQGGLTAGYTLLLSAVTDRMHVDEKTLEAIRASVFTPIFNGQPIDETPRRLMGRSAGWANEIESRLSATLEAAGLLTCDDGERRKTVNDCYALRSLPTMMDEGGIPGTTTRDAKAAALFGRQPPHSDSPEPPHGRVSDLADGDMPLSIMLAVQEGTHLWIFPNGCDKPEDAFLQPLDVGELLVWRGDLVHAGAGYLEDHVRVHAYVDPPHDIYHRPTGKTNRCL